MAFPKSPAHLKPFSRAASFYVTLGALSILLWVISSLGTMPGGDSSSSGGLLPTCPQLLQSLREMRHMASSSYHKYYTSPLRPKKPREQQAAVMPLSAAEGVVLATQTITEQAANTGPAVFFEEEDGDQWHMENPCRSRVELPMLYARRKLAQHLPPNAAWERLLDEYARMHRTCLGHFGGNIADHFFSADASSTAAEGGCKFLLVDIPHSAGLGSKILFQASAVLFAVLTQRVVLLADRSQLNSSMGHFCEPFVGSSWKLPELHSSRIRDYPALWTSPSEFHRWVDKIEHITNDPQKTNNNQQQQQPDELHAVDFGDEFQQQRFYCNTEQEYMSKVTWVSIAGGGDGGGGVYYFLPKLFAVPAFRPALEELFPDRMALAHILRTVFLPSDPVWERIDDINDLYLRHSQSLVGVQLRYFRRGLSQADEAVNDLVNEKVLDCVTANKLLPAPLPLGEYHPSPSVESGHGHRRRNTSKVFIVSLFPGLHDYLSQIYVRRVTASGDGVGLVQLTTQESEEQFGHWEDDVEAFVEIICLSLADHVLLVNPVAPFGGLAQAYGALRPWVISFDADHGGACERAKSVDVCFDQAATESFHCPYDPDFRGLDSVPYIRKCLERDGLGMQLMTDHGISPSSFFPSSEEYSLLNG